MPIMKIKSDRSVVSTARPGSASVRTTIPTFIVLKMDLARGDELVWDVTHDGGERVATIRKVG